MNGDRFRAHLTRESLLRKSEGHFYILLLLEEPEFLGLNQRENALENNGRFLPLIRFEYPLFLYRVQKESFCESSGCQSFGQNQQKRDFLAQINVP